MPCYENAVNTIGSAKRQAGVLLSVLIFIGAIVITPLSKCCAETFSPMIVKSNAITPFNEMRLTKNIFIVSPSPQFIVRDGNAQSDKRQDGSNVNKPPFGRRIVIVVICFFGGFNMLGRGLDYGYRRRKVLAILFESIGILMVFGSVSLWLSNGFRWSWGWWF